MKNRSVSGSFGWWCGVVVVVCTLAAGRGWADGGLRIESFSPQGVVRGVRQVTAVFSEPVVPFADGRSPVQPFSVACPESGKARWLDERTWLYEFPADLPSGLECSFALNGDLRALSGAAPQAPANFSFSTGGPAIVDLAPYGGAEIDEEAYFRVTLTGPVDEQSVVEHVSFVSEGLESPIGVSVVSGADAEAVWKAGYTSSEPGKRVVIKPNLRFPPKTKVKLIWGAGVRAPTGVSLDEDQTFDFTVRGPLAAGVRCLRTNPDADCVPFSPIGIYFTASIPSELAAEVRLVDAAGAEWTQAPTNGSTENIVDSISFPGPFPENVELRVAFPEGFHDDTGRLLEAPPLVVRTAKSPPLAKFRGSFGVIERGEHQVLPVTVRNIEPELLTRSFSAARLSGTALPAKMTRLTSADALIGILESLGRTGPEDSMFTKMRPEAVKTFTVPRASGAEPMEVVGIPLPETGFYLVEIESPILGQTLFGKPASYFVRTAALVTNLAVHLKSGRENSLVWVTALDTGAPVKDAAVTITDCRGRVLSTGRTDGEGIVRAPALPASLPYEYCQGRAAHFAVVASTKDDFSLVLSSWDEGIESWRFSLPTDYYAESLLRARTVTAQSLVRRGDTVRMKHYVRRRSGQGLELPDGALPGVVRMTHLGTFESFDQPLTWSKDGSAVSEWRVPPGAKLGEYLVELIEKLKDKSERSTASGGFRVEDFRVPLMRGVIAAPTEPLIDPRKVDVTAAVAYLAGGAAKRLPVAVRYKVEPWSYAGIKGFDSHQIGNGPVAEGVKKEDFDPNGGGEKPAALAVRNAVLDDAGTAAITLDDLPRQSTLAQLTAELEYKDVAGFVQTVSTSARLWPADTLVALKVDSWLSKDSIPVELVTLSAAGERRAGVEVSLDLLQVKHFANRKRIVGGFYSYDSYQETTRLDTVCRGRTDERGVLTCVVKAPSAGEFFLEGRTTDAAGRTSFSNVSLWVSAEGRQWFGGGDDDRIDVLPEKPSYEAGETARLQVRTPFESATALVSVEREGIIEAFTQKIDSRSPIVEVPIKPGYAPNVFVSVLVVRGRVGGAAPTALVDLGRPAYKLGIANLTVGRKPHEMTVAVTPDREVYRVREKARIKIHAAAALDGAPAAGAEVALAAVDEGILEIEPNMSWNLLDRMMGVREYMVRTSTAQMHVVGRRHFGLKARPAGGGGGKGSTRELFDALLYWNPKVKLDANGDADVEVPLNDSLTSFRIVAVASAGGSLFGTGAASIRSTQDLIIVPGFPQLVRSGDAVSNTVSIRNTTDRAMPVELALSTTDARVHADPQSRVLQPGESAELVWRLVMPPGVAELTYTLEARAGGKIVDAMTMKQRITPPVEERVYAASLRRLEPNLAIPVERPAGALPEIGGLVVSLAARLGDRLAGVVDEMRRYPYTCLEQRVSKAIALDDTAMWSDTMALLPTYIDGNGFLKYFVTENEGSDILSAYLLSIAAARGWEIPAGERGRIVTALQRVADGSHFSSQGSTAVKLDRRLIALEALTRAKEDVTETAAGLVVDPSLLSTSSLINWYAVLVRSPQIPNRAPLLEGARSNLRARLTLSGTQLGFSTESADREWWLMGSVDVNAVRLLDIAVESKEWRSDAPRIAQGAIARQVRGAWDLTVANAWGTLALRNFSAQFEKTPVRGETILALGEDQRTARWPGAKDPEPMTFPWVDGERSFTVTQRGSGAPWVTVYSRAAIPLTEPLARGYAIRKAIEPVIQRTPGVWSVGDIVRVKIDIDAQADRTWVVIDDPLPPGAVVLGGQSLSKSLAAEGAAPAWSDETLFPTFEERTFAAYRAYMGFVPKGRGHLEYTLRLNTAGDFVLPDVRVEALYSPDFFGALPQERFSVAP